MPGLTFPIYLDHHATTPLDPRVLEEMMPYLTQKFGNASSMDHPYGHDASVAVEAARDRIARLVGARHDEIFFTSGATESDNLAIAGVMDKYADRGDHLITCATEHKAVLDAAEHAERAGKTVTYLPVDHLGHVSLGDLEGAITDRTVLISVMAANNEIGTIHDIAAIGRIAHNHNVLFHTDAAQAVGHIPVDVREMNIDLMSFSSHKMYGPKGIGALYVRGAQPRVRLTPLLHGGGQERGIRPGTLNVPAIAGFGWASAIAQKEMASENRRFKKWSAKITRALGKAGATENGDPACKLRHNISLTFPGVEGKAIINSVSKEVAISAGSACTTQTVEPSHVLLALGLAEEDAHSSIRIGLGRFNTEEEIDHSIAAIADAVKSLKMIGMSA